MNNCPQIGVVEVWGESPLYEQRCWVINWPLSAFQILSINQLIVTPEFWDSVQRLVPNLNIPTNLLQVLEEHRCTGSCCLEAIFCLAQSILSPAALNICPLKYQIKSSTLFCAFESNQHEILGDVIKFTTSLLWKCVELLFKKIDIKASQVFEDKLSILVENVDVCCGHSLTEALLSEAFKQKIPYFLLGKSMRLYHFGVGAKGRICSSTMNDCDSYFGVMVAQDKDKSHSLLRTLGLSVPKQLRFSADISDESIQEMANKIGYPCVVKPSNMDRGIGVTANINNLKELKAAIKFAKRSANRPALLIQEHVHGSDFRLNITGSCLEFVVKRSVPVIVGDGIHTVKACIQNLNAARKAMREYDGLSTEIDLCDKEVLKYLSCANLNMESVVEADQIVPLRGNSNVSTGGLYEEINVEDVHPSIARQCLSIAKMLRLDNCGIDYITDDISLDPLHHPGAFIEVNSMPHQQPKRAYRLLQNLFPEFISNIPCSLVLANWGQDSSQLASRALQLLIDEKPCATVACPSALRFKASSCLDDHIFSRLHFFHHPNELLIDRYNSELICLMTPKLLLNKGWMLPRSQIRIVNLIKLSSSSASKALFSYLDVA